MWICVGTVGICSAVVISARKTTVNPTATSRQTISGLLRQRFSLVNVRILRPRNRIPVVHRRRSTCANFARLALPPTHAHTQINTHSHAGNALGSAQSLLCATHKGPGEKAPLFRNRSIGKNIPFVASASSSFVRPHSRGGGRTRDSVLRETVIICGPFLFLNFFSALCSLHKDTQPL
uniref:Putative secreted protein n=1 Tax=Anopheles triannulatus TaxID=58253 RepID=A0A2M4B1W2_9DIPT